MCMLALQAQSADRTVGEQQAISSVYFDSLMRHSNKVHEAEFKALWQAGLPFLTTEVRQVLYIGRILLPNLQKLRQLASSTAADDL